VCALVSKCAGFETSGDFSLRRQKSPLVTTCAEGLMLFAWHSTAWAKLAKLFPLGSHCVHFSLKLAINVAIIWKGINKCFRIHVVLSTFMILEYQSLSFLFRKVFPWQQCVAMPCIDFFKNYTYFRFLPYLSAVIIHDSVSWATGPGASCSDFALSKWVYTFSQQSTSWRKVTQSPFGKY
jgi:hypothetical protein